MCVAGWGFSLPKAVPVLVTFERKILLSRKLAVLGGEELVLFLLRESSLLWTPSGGGFGLLCLREGKPEIHALQGQEGYRLEYPKSRVGTAKAVSVLCGRDNPSRCKSSHPPPVFSLHLGLC